MFAMGMAAMNVTDRVESDVHGAADEGDEAFAIERAIGRREYRDALARCARLYGASIGRLCMAFLGSQGEADEVAQETLLAAYDAFPQYRAEGTVKSYLFGIARRLCARALEKRSRQTARLRLVREETPEVGGDAGDWALRRESAERARRALQELRPTEREALLLRYQGDLSFREVASACGCDEAAARKRVSRGLSRMRELLTEEG
jgi:RNA polymerase sigma-70 factor, ECF subfamily